jgi:zinc carboxypeptidase
MIQSHRLKLFLGTLGLIALFLVNAAAQRPKPDDRVAAKPQSPGQVRYDGSSLVRVFTNDRRDLDRLTLMGGDIWTHNPRLGLIDVLMPEQSMPALRATGMLREVLVADIQPLIDAERASLGLRVGGFFDLYQDYNAISAQVDAWVVQYPALASRQSLGMSIEGRNIFALKIGSPGVNKTAVMFQGLQHAREWIAAMVPMYIADQLLTQAGTNPAISALLSQVDVYIIPVVNPDGYEYSWSTERFWRKNRRNNGGGSFGVDTNRNWGGSWWGGAGSSSNPNSITYRGTAPFSEPETQAVRDFVLAHSELRAMLDIHSYGQCVLSPWGHKVDPTPEPDMSVFAAQNTELELLIESVHALDYFSAPAGSGQLVAAGDAPDWHYGVQELLAWTIELRPLITDPAGFLVNATAIIPNGQEMFPAALEIIRYATQSLDLRLVSPPTAPVAPNTPIVLNILAHPYPMFTAVDEGVSSVEWENLTTTLSGSVPFVLTTPWNYTATIPGQPEGTQIAYHLVSASLPAGNVTTLPFDAPAVRLSIAIGRPADLNNDGVVDGSDLGLMLSNWGGTGVGDLNSDGVVNGADLGLMLGSWG